MMSGNDVPPSTVLMRRLTRLVSATAVLAALVLISAAPADATTPHLPLTPNPTCGSAGTITVCVQAWSNGITASYTGESSSHNEQTVGFQNGDTEFATAIGCIGTSFSVFTSLPPGEWEGYATILPIELNGPGGKVLFDLMVGGQGSEPAPPTSCVPENSTPPTGILSSAVVGIAASPDGRRVLAGRSKRIGAGIR